MMPRPDMERLPWTMQQELRRIAAMLFEQFTETMKGRLSERYRTGRIVRLLLHGEHAQADWWNVAPGAPVRLLAIVNHPKLARRGQDWQSVRDRLRHAWEFGEITHPVRLAVRSLDEVNCALVGGVPHFVTIATEGITLYEAAGTPLKTPRHLPEPERRTRGRAEFERWYGRATDFLAGAGFYERSGNAPMAALLIHQACEHLYQCVAWTLTLHGRRTHALDELREIAEAQDKRLCAAWPREQFHERRAFACVRRAYVEVRYGQSFRIDTDELAWAMDRAVTLHALVKQICGERLDTPFVAREAVHVL
jgi:HEPN domain-containing protein